MTHEQLAKANQLESKINHLQGHIEGILNYPKFLKIPYQVLIPDSNGDVIGDNGNKSWHDCYFCIKPGTKRYEKFIKILKEELDEYKQEFNNL